MNGLQQNMRESVRRVQGQHSKSSFIKLEQLDFIHGIQNKLVYLQKSMSFFHCTNIMLKQEFIIMK